MRAVVDYADAVRQPGKPFQFLRDGKIYGPWYVRLDRRNKKEFRYVHRDGRIKGYAADQDSLAWWRTRAEARAFVKKWNKIQAS